MWRPRNEKQSLDVGTTWGQVLESAVVLHSFVAQLPWDGEGHGSDRVSKDLGKMIMFLGGSTKSQLLSQWTAL